MEDFVLDFGSKESPGKVDAGELKTLILRAHAARANDPSLPHSISISHADVGGRLELDGLFSDHIEALIGLVFVGCRFADPILMNGSCVTMLTFKDCRISSFSAVRAKVLGTVRFLEITSAERPGRETGVYAEPDWHKARGPKFLRLRQGPVLPGRRPQGRCSISFRGARIGGDFRLEESVLVAREPTRKVDTKDQRGDSALVLSGAYVENSVFIRKHSALLGGLAATDIRIDDAFHVSGALLRSSTRPALTAQRIRVGGYLALRNHCPPGAPQERTEIYGTVDLLNALIDSAIDLTGAYIESTERSSDALVLSAAEIDQLIADWAFTGEEAVFLTEIKGAVNFDSLSVAHNFRLVARLREFLDFREDAAEAYPVLRGNSARIGGHAIFAGNWEVSADLANIHIDGSLYLGHGDRALQMVRPAEDQLALGLNGARIGGAIVPEQFEMQTHANLDTLHRALRSKSEFDTRISQLPFARNAQLIEYSTAINGQRHYGMALELKGRIHFQTGEGPFFFGPLTRHGIQGDNQSAQLDYLRTFCAVVMAKAGPFRIVEPGDWFASQMTARQRSKVKPSRILESDKPNILRVEATIWYATALFHANLVLDTKTLKVSMTDDAPLDEDLPALTTLSRPLVTATGEAPGYDEVWHLPCPVPGGQPVLGIMDDSLRRRLKRALPKIKPYSHDRPVIDLGRAHAARLEDNDGNGWPQSTRLELAGLTYDALAINTDRSFLFLLRKLRRDLREAWLVMHAKLGPIRTAVLAAGIYAVLGLAAWFVVRWVLMPTADLVLNHVNWLWLVVALMLFVWLRRVQRNSLVGKHLRLRYARRRRWLRLQYVSFWPTRTEFNPQPFEQLARTLRKQGLEEEYRLISRLQARWQNATLTPWIWRPFAFLHRFCFGYGYSLKRGVATFLLAVALGWIGTHAALNREMLVLDTPIDLAASGSANSRDTSPCGREIVPALYALDVFLPLIELGQERRCRIRTDVGGQMPNFPPFPNLAFTQPQTVPSEAMRWVGHMRIWGDGVANLPRNWQIAATLYKMSGWIISSLLVLTFTRVFRRSSEV